jgi:protein-S-isoprenylcysteine O-methyltransferase Ste14
MALYQQIVAVCWLVLVLVWAVLAAGSSPGRYSPRAWAMRLTLAAILVIGAYLSSQGRLPRGVVQPPGGVALAGAALCVAGLAFALWARISMGRQWGMPMTLRDKPMLVTTGPFAYVRHPIYTGIATMLIGSALTNPVASVAAVVLTAYFIYSARREERDMLRLWPDVYPAYVQRTKRFVPFVF